MPNQDEARFDIFLADIDDRSRIINIIKIVRETRGTGLKAAQDFIEYRPEAIKEGITWDEAINIQGKFAEIGANTFILPKFKKWDFTVSTEFKQLAITAFNNTPKGYGTNGDFHWNHAKELVDYANLQAGQRILDAATGTAPAAIMAAQIVGPTATVTGIDLSTGMLEQARQNIKAAGLVGRVQLVEGDAENLPFENGSFDVILCASAVPWFSDIPRAFREFWRVLKPDGQFTFSCWGGDAKATRTNLLNEALEPFGKRIPELNGRINNSKKVVNLLKVARFNFTRGIHNNETSITGDAVTDFLQNWPGISSRFGIILTETEVEKVKSGYSAGFDEMSRINPKWKRDYVQFVTAFENL